MYVRGHLWVVNEASEASVDGDQGCREEQGVVQDLDVLFMLVCDGGWKEENRGKEVGGPKGAAGSAESSGLRCPLSQEVQESAENH